MKILITLLALISATAFAGDRTTAYEMICSKLSFESERKACIEQIKPFNYFSEDALRICANFNFNSKKLECLGYISDRYYEGYEIDTCRNTTFDSEKLRCLRESGNTNGGGESCLPRREVLNQLNAGLNELRSGNTGTVEKRLMFLINKFNICQ